MYFANNIGNEGIGVFRSSYVPFENNQESVYEGFISIEEGKLVVTNKGVNLFANGFSKPAEATTDEYLPKLKTGLSYNIIKDTADNPMIIVLCHSITLFDKIPANIKYIKIDDDTMLACLVYGACEFDGIAMQRCNTLDTQYVGEKKTPRRKKVVKPKDIYGVTYSIDKESGYDYSFDAVLQVELKVNGDTWGSKFCKEGLNIFFKEKLEQHREHARVVAENRRREAEEAKIRRAKAAEAARIAEEKAKEAKLAEEEAKAALLAKKKEKKAVSSSSAVGAKDFLSAVLAKG